MSEPIQLRHRDARLPVERIECECMAEILLCAIILTLSTLCKAGDVKVVCDRVGAVGGIAALLKHLLRAIVLSQFAFGQRGEYIGLAAAVRGGFPCLRGLGGFALRRECDSQPVKLLGEFGLRWPTGAQIFRIFHRFVEILCGLSGLCAARAFLPFWIFARTNMLWMTTPPSQGLKR